MVDYIFFFNVALILCHMMAHINRQDRETLGTSGKIKKNIINSKWDLRIMPMNADYSASCRWWVYKRTAPWRFFELLPAGPRRLKPHAHSKRFTAVMTTHPTKSRTFRNFQQLRLKQLLLTTSDDKAIKVHFKYRGVTLAATSENRGLTYNLAINTQEVYLGNLGISTSNQPFLPMCISWLTTVANLLGGHSTPQKH